MTLDPRIGFWLGVIMLLVLYSATGAGANQLGVIFGVAAGTKISGACAYVGGILGILVTALHGVPSKPADSKAFYLGPSAPALPPAAKVIVFIAALLVGLALNIAPSYAQVRHETPRPEARPEVTKTDIFHPLPAPSINQSDIATFLGDLADIDGAASLSTAIPGLQDPVGLACWQQFSPIQALIKAHPLPLTFKVASDIEAARLAMIAMNQVCANPNCGQMFVDATNAVSAIVGNPLNVSLQSLCSKVPVIGTNAVPTSSLKAAPIGTTPQVPVTSPVAK